MLGCFALRWLKKKNRGVVLEGKGKGNKEEGRVGGKWKVREEASPQLRNDDVVKPSPDLAAGHRSSDDNFVELARVVLCFENRYTAALSSVVAL